MTDTAIYWARRDLRLADNRALAAALANHDQVICLFVATPEQWHEHQQPPLQTDFILRRASYLKAVCDSQELIWIDETADRFSDLPQLLLKICKEKAVKHLYANSEYEINELCRDRACQTLLNNHDISLRLLDDKCLIEPSRLRSKQNTPFKVFSAYRKAWLSLLTESDVAAADTGINIADEVAFIDSKSSADSNYYAVDDKAIYTKLRRFLEHRVENYHQARDLPALDGTSQLSPYLATGSLSVRQCVRYLLHLYPGSLTDITSGNFSWLNELIWRDFYQYICYHFNQVCKNQPFIPWTNDIHWGNSAARLTAWQQGNTGYPIVDAGMRQLTATGWMHNRVRMITASFLVKDLQIDWREGERWFSRHLIDWDFPANNGGWQWSASTGTDAQPYFRIFNPVSQSEKFDKDGDYIRHWVPELKDVPTKNIHWPHDWLKLTGATNYSAPIVDHKAAREITLTLFKQAKSLAF